MLPAIQVENVLSVLYVPALHAGKGQGDACLLTGFSPGTLGLWIPPYPVRPGAVYELTRIFDAHLPGSLRTLPDGSQVGNTPTLTEV